MFLKNFRVSVVEKRKKDDQNKLVQDHVKLKTFFQKSWLSRAQQKILM